MVYNSKKFFERMRKAINNQSLLGGAGLVEYYDPETFSGHFDDKRTAFFKPKHFAHQKEYRFIVNTSTKGNNPITLNIGHIRDIACCQKNLGIDIKFFLQ